MKIRIIASLLIILSLVFIVSCRRNKDSFIKDDSPGYDYSDSDTQSTSDDDETDNDEDDDLELNTESNVDSELKTDTDTETDNESDDTNSDVAEIDPLVGKTFISESGLKFVIIPGRTLSVVDYVGKAGNINIPKEYEGYKVTEIGEYAFSGYGVEAADCQSMLGFVTIYIPETVTVIRKGAFTDCSDIKPEYDTYTNEKPLSEWLSNLVIEEENKHVSDVLHGLRPAIGWGKYFIP